MIIHENIVFIDIKHFDCSINILNHQEFELLSFQ